MKHITILILMLLLGLVTSCEDGDDITNVVGYDRTFVLITDFDENSDFVIRLKGEVSQNHPATRFEFVKVKDFNVAEGSYQLLVTAREFGPDTYITTVVDPGSDSKKMVFKRDNGQRFIAPDNGIASRIFDAFTTTEPHYIENTDLFGGSEVNKLSFSDFYSYAIDELLSDTAPEVFGSAVAEPVTFEVTAPSVQDDTIMGEFLYFDNFGNGITNITAEYAEGLNFGDLLQIMIGETKIFVTYGQNYASVPVGQNVIKLNSAGRLELAVNYGNMEARYSLNAGQKITISPASPIVGILKFNDSPVITEIVEKLKSQLETLGYISGTNVSYVERSANGEFTALSSAVTEILEADVDFFVSVSTPASQVAANLVPESIPLMFTYVTDPVSAGLYDIRSNITGLSDATNFDDYCNFIQELMPDISIAGTLYNDTEDNSKYANSELRNISVFKGIELISETCNAEDEIQSDYETVVSQGAQAILIVADNTMTSAMPTITQAATGSDTKVPVIGDSYVHCRDGAMAAISVDYAKLGTESGNMAFSILQGMQADDTPYINIPTSVVSVNTTTAQQIGFTIPQSILDKATYKYE